MTTGKTLRMERIAADVLFKDLLAAMGVSRTTLWAIERRAEVPAAQVVLYRDSLARLQTARKAA